MYPVLSKYVVHHDKSDVCSFETKFILQSRVHSSLWIRELNTGTQSKVIIHHNNSKMVRDKICLYYSLTGSCIRAFDRYQNWWPEWPNGYVLFHGKWQLLEPNASNSPNLDPSILSATKQLPRESIFGSIWLMGDRQVLSLEWLSFLFLDDHKHTFIIDNKTRKIKVQI